MNRRNLFASLATFASIAGLSQTCFAQALCDTAPQAGDVVSSDGWSRVFDSDSDYDGCVDSFSDPAGGVDLNGGCNESTPSFDYLGVIAPGSSVRYRGALGVFYQAPECNGNPASGLSRDVDWIQFSVSEPCYVTVSLSLKDKDGNPVDLDADPATGSYMFVATGPETTNGTTYCADEGGYVGFYSEFGSCPQDAFVTLPNGIQKSDMPVPAGRHMIVLTVDDFNTTLYGGECEYVLTVNVTPLLNESCGTSTESCTEAHATPGCNDSLCCETVCGILPACCQTEWDQNCISTGVDECGLFIYECVTNASVPNDCAGQAEFIDASVLPITFGFDATQATNDGPNNVNTLCVSNTTRDVWYVIGPMAYDGLLQFSMCGFDNVGDAVLGVYALGVDETTGEPITAIADGSELPSKFVGCNDDACDDDNDDQLDFGGPSAGTANVLQGRYYLVRIGTFLDDGQDPDDETILGLQGSIRVSFQAVLFSNGPQTALDNNADGTGTNLFWTSGNTGTNVKRWMWVPFETADQARIEAVDFAAQTFNDTFPEKVGWRIIARNGEDPDHGAFGRPFGNGTFDATAILFEGSEPFDFTVGGYNAGDDSGAVRRNVAFSTPFDLAPGMYYYTTFGENADGSPTDFGWGTSPQNGLDMMLTSLNNIGGLGAANTNTESYQQQTGYAFGWRGVGGAGAESFVAYQIFVKNGNDTSQQLYTARVGTPEGAVYQASFRLKGSISIPCFGDIDGSGEVDNGDVAFALLDYGPCPGCSTDLDGTGEVDFGDVALILLSTGPCS